MSKEKESADENVENLYTSTSGSYKVDAIHIAEKIVLETDPHERRDMSPEGQTRRKFIDKKKFIALQKKKFD